MGGATSSLSGNTTSRTSTDRRNYGFGNTSPTSSSDRQRGNSASPNDIRGGAEAGQGQGAINVNINLPPPPSVVQPDAAPTPQPKPVAPKGNTKPGPATDAVAQNNGYIRPNREATILTEASTVKKRLLGL